MKQIQNLQRGSDAFKKYFGISRGNGIVTEDESDWLFKVER